MLPSVVVRQVELALLDYLRTTFRLQDHTLEKALFDFLRHPERGLFKGPYLDLKLPFRRDDGAQGSDVACLIRRLKDRLAIPPGTLACVGTSATIAGSAPGDPRVPLVEFAQKVFGEPFGLDGVITEDRMTVDEFLVRDHEGPEPESLDLPNVDDAVLDPERYASLDEYLATQAQAWVAIPPHKKVVLGALLSQHPFSRQLLRAIEGRDGRGGPWPKLGDTTGFGNSSGKADKMAGLACYLDEELEAELVRRRVDSERHAGQSRQDKVAPARTAWELLRDGEPDLEEQAIHYESKNPDERCWQRGATHEAATDDNPCLGANPARSRRTSPGSAVRTPTPACVGTLHVDFRDQAGDARPMTPVEAFRECARHAPEAVDWWLDLLAIARFYLLDEIDALPEKAISESARTFAAALVEQNVETLLGSNP